MRSELHSSSLKKQVEIGREVLEVSPLLVLESRQVEEKSVESSAEEYSCSKTHTDKRTLRMYMDTYSSSTSGWLSVR